MNRANPELPTDRPVRLVLVGIGHASLELLRRIIVEPQRDIELIAVSASDKHHYSGMVPGFLRGTYDEGQIAFELPPLVARAGGEFLEAEVVGVDVRKRRVLLQGGEAVEFDLVCFNLGSRAAGQDVAAVRRHALSVKPMYQATALWDATRALAEDGWVPDAWGADSDRASHDSDRRASSTAVGRSIRHIAVVGGGAAGFEVACSIAGYLDEVGVPRKITLLEAGQRILKGYSRRVVSTARTILGRMKIELRTGAPVVALADGTARLDGGRTVTSDLTVWLTGAAAPPIFRAPGLGTDDAGYLEVDAALRSVSDPHVFGAGDCVTMVDHPELPKAGVYSVRQGPVLWESVLGTIRGRQLPAYKPQPSFLSILNTGDGKSLLRYKGLVSYSRWAWWLKDRIDRGFMLKYQSLV